MYTIQTQNESISALIYVYIETSSASIHSSNESSTENRFRSLGRRLCIQTVTPTCTVAFQWRFSPICVFRKPLLFLNPVNPPLRSPATSIFRERGKHWFNGVDALALRCSLQNSLTVSRNIYVSKQTERTVIKYNNIMPLQILFCLVTSNSFILVKQYCSFIGT